ncbi:hypothetical protein H8A95_05130 [Bradyrhizobium sp. Pear76]|uniref:hypothetical protein n=1 Tax=Bradyrhizobium oropedii TaxID=1571201 RepID=UPI001E597AA9|nr:hypothetical protein [Bradyrhizobium oropedii]MCC8961718.1 hypothetical protein [Bradyrhizobium oropedii]
MSDSEQARDAAGQFISPEKTLGVHSLEIDQGFIPRPDAVQADGNPDEDRPWEHSSDEESLRALAQKTWGDPKPDILNIVLLDAEGNRAPENLAQTVEQAASDLRAVETEIAEANEAAELAKIAAEVDRARSERINGNPDIATYYGLDLGEVQANAEKAKAEAKPTDAKAADAEAKPVEADGKPEAGDTEPSVDGLDPEVAKALKHPQVRQAIEAEIGRADATRQELSTAIETANRYAQQSLVDHFPELAQIPLENWDAALQILHQHDPQRVQRAMSIAERVNTLSIAQTQWQQHQAVQAEQQFQANVGAEDARLEQVLGKAGAAEANKALVSFLDDHGIGRNQAYNFVRQHPVLSTAEGREIILKAAKYDALKKAGLPRPESKPVPKVQKPGVAAPNGARAAESIQALTARLSSSGSPEDAYELYLAQNKARGR